AEDRAAIIEQIELDVTAPTRQLPLAFVLAPGLLCVAPDNVAVSSNEALTDVTHEGEIGVERGISGIACAVEIVEENAADAARLLAVLEIEIFVAPSLVALGVGDAGMALAGRPHGRLKGDRVWIVRLAT